MQNILSFTKHSFIYSEAEILLIGGWYSAMQNKPQLQVFVWGGLVSTKTAAKTHIWYEWKRRPDGQMNGKMDKKTLGSWEQSKNLDFRSKRCCLHGGSWRKHDGFRQFKSICLTILRPPSAFSVGKSAPLCDRGVVVEKSQQHTPRSPTMHLSACLHLK